MSLLNFLQYHNAVPVALSIALLGAGGVFAATNPEAFYASEQRVVAIDNTYIAAKDLSAFTPVVQIGIITEDDEHYYVNYTLSTIDVDDYVWRDVTKTATMKVSKADLGPYRDLGLYVSAQLKQIIDRELQRLRETQDIERRQVSSKVVATAYGGLVGLLLNDKTEELPGYTPVVTPPEAPPKPQPPPPPPEEPAPEPSAPAPEPVTEPPSPPPATTTPPEPPPAPSPAPTPTPSSTSTPTDTTSPVLQVLGDNPAEVEVGSDYDDLGAAATDNSNETLDILVYLDGETVEEVVIDTSVPGEWTVRYEATDSAGNTGEATRTVVVTAPPPPPTPPPTPGPSTSTPSTPAPAPPPPSPEPASPPSPEPTPPPPAPSPSSEPSPPPASPPPPAPAPSPEPPPPPPAPEPAPPPSPPTPTPPPTE